MPKGCRAVGECVSPAPAACLPLTDKTRACQPPLSKELCQPYGLTRTHIQTHMHTEYAYTPHATQVCCACDTLKEGAYAPCWPFVRRRNMRIHADKHFASPCRHLALCWCPQKHKRTTQKAKSNVQPHSPQHSTRSRTDEQQQQNTHMHNTAAAHNRKSSQTVQRHRQPSTRRHDSMTRGRAATTD